MGISWEFRNYGAFKMDYAMRLFMDISAYLWIFMDISI